MNRVNPMSSPKREIENIALRVIAQNPGPVVRVRLLRDVLSAPRGDAELKRARAHLDASRCVRALAAEQRADGGWGAFHSRSTTAQQKIPSTEVGVERAIALGLDAAHPILRNARDHIVSILTGARPFPDRPEKNERWQIGRRMFLGSTLSLIQPDYPLIDADRQLWREIALQTFQSGTYNARDEIRAHAELTGATVQDSYLTLNNRYAITILGSRPGLMPRQIETALCRWLWSRVDGIGYLGIRLHRAPPRDAPGAFDRWLTSQEMLTRLFPAWRGFGRDAIEWLWAQRDARGSWDFGSRSSASVVLPLSDDWRARQNRTLDWTTRILVLIRSGM